MALQPYAPLELFKISMLGLNHFVGRGVMGHAGNRDCGYNQTLLLIASTKPQGANEADITG